MFFNHQLGKVDHGKRVITEILHPGLMKSLSPQREADQHQGLLDHKLPVSLAVHGQAPLPLGDAGGFLLITGHKTAINIVGDLE